MTSPTPTLPFKEQEHALVSPIQQTLTERRSKARYALVLNVRYRAFGPKPHSGVGQVVNLSSRGGLVVSRHELNVGEELEVQIEWPSPLDGEIPLQLVAVGIVVRCGTSRFAMRFRRYQFRTVRSHVQPIATSVFRKPSSRLSSRKVETALR